MNPVFIINQSNKPEKENLRTVIPKGFFGMTSEAVCNELFIKGEIAYSVGFLLEDVNPSHYKMVLELVNSKKNPNTTEVRCVEIEKIIRNEHMPKEVQITFLFDSNDENRKSKENIYIVDIKKSKLLIFDILTLFQNDSINSYVYINGAYYCYYENPRTNKISLMYNFNKGINFKIHKSQIRPIDKTYFDKFVKKQGG